MKIKSISALETWPLRHEVLWPNMPLDFIKLPEDSSGYHFGVFCDSKLVSIISLYQTERDTVQFRKFATKVSEQGKGYGTALLSYVIEFAKNEGFKVLWCNARWNKTNFYKNFGMFETEETYLKENIKFVILKKVL